MRARSRCAIAGNSPPRTLNDFIKGKFCQCQRNIPFSAFVQAFHDLMGQVLSESTAGFDIWQEKILAAVGDSGQVLIDAIPLFKQVIGEQPAVPELSGSAAQNRNRLLQKFIAVFTTLAHPLVMFLDDLQWANLAALNLIEKFFKETNTRLRQLKRLQWVIVFYTNEIILSK